MSLSNVIIWLCQEVAIYTFASFGEAAFSEITRRRTIRGLALRVDRFGEDELIAFDDKVGDVVFGFSHFSELIFQPEEDDLLLLFIEVPELIFALLRLKWSALLIFVIDLGIQYFTRRVNKELQIFLVINSQQVIIQVCFDFSSDQEIRNGAWVKPIYYPVSSKPFSKIICCLFTKYDFSTNRCQRKV